MLFSYIRKNGSDVPAGGFGYLLCQRRMEGSIDLTAQYLIELWIVLRDDCVLQTPNRGGGVNTY